MSSSMLNTASITIQVLCFSWGTITEAGKLLRISRCYIHDDVSMEELWNSTCGGPGLFKC